MREMTVNIKSIKIKVIELNKREISGIIKLAKKKRGAFFSGEVFVKKTEEELKKKLAMVLMDSSGTLLIPY